MWASSHKTAQAIHVRSESIGITIDPGGWMTIDLLHRVTE